MFGTLRFRLTAVFLAVVLVFGLVSIALALRLFQDATRTQSVRELRREASGLAALYAESALRSSDEGSKAPEFAAEKLELATGDELYYIGASLFPGQRFGLTRLPRSALGDSELDRDRQVIVEFTPPGEDRRLIAAVQPVQLVSGTEPFGWLIVAKATAELREQWLTLLGRLALALAVGVLLAALLFMWLSRRLTEPVRALTRATEDVAAGRYDVEIPEARGRDEVALLSQRFRGMVAKLAEAEQLKRSFLMSVSHELRTPLTAIRGHVEALREGIVTDPEQVQASLEIVVAETDRLERLVGDVLDLAKLQAHRFTVRHEEVDLNRVLDHAYGAFAEEARRREIDYRLVGADAAPVIVSDGDRVLQVITNLLSNAFRWTPDGGRIELQLAASNGGISVDVVDSGPGCLRSSEPESSTRSFPGTRTAPASGCRSPASSPSRSVATSSSRRPAAPEVVSGCCFRSSQRASVAGATTQAAAACSTRTIGRKLDRLVLDQSVLGCCGMGRSALEPGEPGVDAAPPGAHEVDEKREVVHARVPLGEKLSLQPLESSDCLVQQSADLGDMPRDREYLGSEAVADGRSDLCRDRRLERRGGVRQRFDLTARPRERSLELRAVRASCSRVGNALLRPFERLGIHGGEATLSAGWTLRSSTTSSRPS